jgi:hypothetical protein
MRHHRLLLPVVVSLMSLALLAGCRPSNAPTSQDEPATLAVAASPAATRSPSATPEPSPTMPEPTEEPTAEPEATENPAAGVGLLEGWVLEDRSADGFTVALPPTWKALDLSPEAWESYLQVLGEANPQFSQLLAAQAQSLLASGCKLWALELDPAAVSSGRSANITVLEQSQTVELPLELLVQLTVGQLENVEGIAKPIKHRTVTVGGCEAEELEIRLDANSLDGSTIHVYELEYVLVRDKILYAITLAAPADRAEEIAPVFEQIIESLTFIEP